MNAPIKSQTLIDNDITLDDKFDTQLTVQLPALAANRYTASIGNTVNVATEVPVRSLKSNWMGLR